MCVAWCACVCCMLSTNKVCDLLQQFCVFARLLCSAGITNGKNFTLAVAPPFVHPIMSLPAMPTHSVRQYGMFSEPTQGRQVANMA